VRRFGAGDLPLGTFRAATDKWAENETERRELGRVADIMDRHLAKRLNFGAPITVPRANFAHKKAKPPKAGGKRRRWKKNRAVIANTRRVYQRSIDELRHCDAVLVLPGYERSEGTKGEIAEAERLKLPIFAPYRG